MLYRIFNFYTSSIANSAQKADVYILFFAKQVNDMPDIGKREMLWQMKVESNELTCKTIPNKE